jgi:hypothetical protein
MDLQIPSLRKPDGNSFNSSPAVVRQWVADLPLVNTGRTADLLHAALSEMNGLRVPAYDRFDDLEQLAEPVNYVIDALKKKFLGRRFPLDVRALEQANLATTLCMKMATGYKIVASELDRQRKGGTPLEQAIQNAIRYLGEALLGSYLIYVPYPAGIWRSLHSLYAFAVRHGLADVTADGTLSPVDGKQTIGDSYKQCLLLSLACPYRMRQSEIRSVNALMADWSKHCQLHATAKVSASGYFACHLDSDEPPGYLREDQRDALDSSWIIIDTRGLEEPVRATIDRRRESTARLSTLPDETVLQRLMLSWGMMPKRRFPRRGGESLVRLLVGLAAIHRALGGPAGARSAGNATAASQTVKDGDYLRDPTFEQTTSFDTRLPDRHSEESPFRGAYSPGARVDNRSLRIESWKMHDMSAGGYCLLWDSADASSAQVGELVAITEGDEDSNWLLGVVRWMRFTPSEGLALGVQMLPPGARPVWASVCKDLAGMEDRMHGILLPGLPATGQPATLLLPTLPFHSGCLSTLSEADSKKTIRLTGQIEDTGSFAQFHFAEDSTG